MRNWQQKQLCSLAKWWSTHFHATSLTLHLLCQPSPTTPLPPLSADVINGSPLPYLIILEVPVERDPHGGGGSGDEDEAGVLRDGHLLAYLLGANSIEKKIGSSFGFQIHLRVLA